jgi:hypothetical protein
MGDERVPIRDKEFEGQCEFTVRLSNAKSNESWTVSVRGTFCRQGEVSTYAGEHAAERCSRYPIHLAAIKIKESLAWCLRRANAPARVNAVHYLRNYTARLKVQQRPYSELH